MLIAGVPNLTKLLDSTFLQNNRNIQQAINNVIIKKSIYKYDNAATPFKISEFLIGTLRRTTDFYTSVEAQEFDGYCVENDIEFELEFSYMMRTILDWVELEKLLSSLKSSNFVKIRLKIDLYDSDYTFDFDRIPLLVGPIKERLIALSIYLPLSDCTRGAIDLEFLKDVEVLESTNCQINGTFSQCRNLKELEYMPLGIRNPMDILRLPLTLKHLHLYSCGYIKGDCNKSAQFPSLELISVW